MDNLSDIFESVYKNKEWGDDAPFFSGPGSYDPYLVSPYIEIIKSFIKDLPYKPNITDVGCGDFNIGKQLISYANSYLAVDVVDSLIEYNKTKYKDLDVNFKTLDITKDYIFPTDIIILRDVLQHLSNKHVKKALQNIYLKSKYLIITDPIPCYKFTPNLDIDSSSVTRTLINKSGLDILSPPFNFPIEEELITLSIRQKDGSDEIVKTTIYKTKYE
jgi:hypothetical protein